MFVMLGNKLGRLTIYACEMPGRKQKPSSDRKARDKGPALCVWPGCIWYGYILGDTMKENQVKANQYFNKPQEILPKPVNGHYGLS